MAATGFDHKCRRRVHGKTHVDHFLGAGIRLRQSRADHCGKTPPGRATRRESRSLEELYTAYPMQV